MSEILAKLKQQIKEEEIESSLTMACQCERLEGKGLESSKLTAKVLERLIMPEEELPLDEEGDADHAQIEELRQQAIAQLETELKQQQEAVKRGDLSSVEEILVNQLNLLNLMFLDSSIKLNSLISEGYLLKKDSGNQIQRLVDLTLRLQNQTIKTARVITDIKKPRQTTFIKKYVSQQLNQLLTNQKLALEESENAAVDFRGETETISVNSEMETLGEINRPAL